jgi:hypothetical protein
VSDLWNLILGDDEPGGPITRAAKAAICLRCDGCRLDGLDSDRCALDVHVDPEPISAFGELQATLAGLRTFEIRRVAGGYHLEWRDAGHIRVRPAGSGRVDVLVEHRCGFVVDRAPPVLRVRSVSVFDVPPF